MEQRVVTVIQGQSDLIRRHLAISSQEQEDWTFTLRGNPNFLPPWAGARRLLAFLRARIGHDVVDDALAQRSTGLF